MTSCMSDTQIVRAKCSPGGSALLGPPPERRKGTSAGRGLSWKHVARLLPFVRSAPWLVLFSLGLSLIAPSLALAEPTVSVHAPLLSLARAESFTPVYVDITTAEPLQGEILISFDEDSARTVRPFSVGRQSTRRVSVPVLIPPWSQEIKVEVRKGRKRLAVKTLEARGTAGNVDELHIVAIGEDPLGLTLLREVTGQPIVGHNSCGDERRVQVETLLPDSMPTAWFGWTSVDLVVWRRPVPSELTPEQQRALRGWVLSGGTLVVGLADNHASWTGSPLGDLTGGAVTGMTVSPDAFHTLLDLAGEAEGAEVSDASLPIVMFSPGAATARLVEEGLPVLDNTVGAGRVVTLGFDPAAGELRGVLNRETFWRNMFGLPEVDEFPLAHAGAPTPRGFDPCLDDDWTMWRSNLELGLTSFVRANPLPLSLVLVFGLVYLLLIGPVDFLVSRKLGKPLWSWVTFPVTAVGFTLLAAMVVFFQKSGENEVRCIEVVDLFTDEGSIRGSAWCSMWSSGRQSVRVPVARGDGLVLAGGGSDGFVETPPPGNAELLTEPTRIGLGFRANQWSVSTWRSAWVDENEGGITAGLSNELPMVSSRAGFDLEQAWVVHGPWMWSVGPLATGSEASLGARTSLSWGTITGEPEAEEYDMVDGPERWKDSWALLFDPQTEHVARLPPLRVSERPMLVGRVAHGLAAPTPELGVLRIETFTLVRAPLPVSFLELL